MQSRTMGNMIEIIAIIICNGIKNAIEMLSSVNHIIMDGIIRF